MEFGGLVIVKNTFLDVPGTTERAPARRSNSLPPALRLFAQAIPEDESVHGLPPATEVSLTTSDRSCSPSPASKPYTASEASTEEPVEEEECSASDNASLAEVARGASSSTGMASTGRMKLSSKAKAWEPTSVLKDPAFDALAVEVEQIMTNTKLVLEAEVLSGGVGFVLATGWQGSSLLIHLNQEHAAMAEAVLNMAKQALLQAAEISAATYVLGYKGQPFSPQPGGFVATLGALWDTSSACWDTYMWGCCNRHNCRWQHPSHTALVSVTIEVSCFSNGDMEEQREM